MNAKYRYRKQFQELLTKTGVKGVTVLEEKLNRTTAQKRNELVNPQKRIINAMMELNEVEQLKALAMLKLEAEKRDADNKELENG